MINEINTGNSFGDSDIDVMEAPVNPMKQFLLNTPLPATTRTYKTISHGSLMDITLESLDTCGFQLRKEIYTMNSEGQVANGKYHLEYGQDNEMGLMIAWQNSYNKKISLKFGIGSHVFICENGLICADMATFKSKHVGQVQSITPQELREAICRAGEGFDRMVKDKERLKEIEVTKRVTAELLGRMFIDDAIITSTQLNIIKSELKKPTFDYGVSPDSAWSLLNHITYSSKNDSPEYWMQRSLRTHKFFVNEFSL